MGSHMAMDQKGRENVYVVQDLFYDVGLALKRAFEFFITLI